MEGEARNCHLSFRALAEVASGFLSSNTTSSDEYFLSSFFFLVCKGHDGNGSIRLLS